MINKNILIAIITTGVLFLGCVQKPQPVQESVKIVEKEYYPLTSNMIGSNNGLNESQLFELQLYTFNDIVLHKQSSGHTVKKVEDGVLVLDNQSTSNQIFIKSGTPCKVITMNDGLITVEFEEDYQLSFAISKNECCENNGKYYLAANSWLNGIGTLSVKGKDYKAIGSSGKAFLRISKEYLDNVDSSFRTLDGKKITKVIEPQVLPEQTISSQTVLEQTVTPSRVMY